MNDKDIKQTIEFWESWLNQKKTTNIGEFMIYGGRSLDVCKKYLQEKAERENPQPLTLEQLKERIGKPICTEYISLTPTRQWEILCGIDKEYITLCAEDEGGVYDCDINTYGRTWLAYDHEPGGEA